MGEALFAYSPAARRAAKSVRKALLRKAAETDVHAAGFGTKIGGLRPSDASQGFFDSLGRAFRRVLFLAFFFIFYGILLLIPQLWRNA